MINSLLKPFERYLPENNRLERIWKLGQVDFKKRYYNDKLGLFWALLNPLFQISIYYVIFTYVFGTTTMNYGLFLFSGMLLWFGFAELTQGGMSIVKAKKYLIENIQFNKLDLYFSQLISVYMGIIFNFISFLLLCLFFGVRFDFTFWLFIPLFFNIALIGMGVSMMLTVLQSYFKDIKHIWTIVMLFGFWSSGIFFRGEKFIEFWPPFLYINPFVGIIINFRAITIGTGMDDWNWSLFWADMLYGVVMYAIGYYILKKYSGKIIELL